MDVLTYEIEQFNDTKAFDYINLKVYINDNYAGYGMVRYVTEDSLKKCYPNGVYDFIHKDDREYPDIENVEKKDLKKYGVPENWDNMEKKDRIKFFNSEHGKSYNMFKNYFLNKPAFFYVRLFKKGEEINAYSFDDYGLTKKPIGISEVDYNHTGLGKFLYLKMAKILSEKNLNLVSAQTLSNDSKRMWQSLMKNYEEDVVLHRKRFYLNGENIQVFIPAWCHEEVSSFKIG